jgi:archaellum component FlaC|tara:strand:+ start:2895 stop:3092 length:198 start_codon:yes stop_codon:yes gene_type:complete
MAFRNKELVDKRFTNIKSKVKNLDLMVARGQSSAQDFRNGLKDLYETIEDLESLVEREASPLRNG